MKVDMKDVQEDFKRYQAEIDELKAENERLKRGVKKAFWWSAEFTKTVHNNKMQAAWEDFQRLRKLQVSKSD